MMEKTQKLNTMSPPGTVDMEVVWKGVEKDEELQKIIDNLKKNLEEEKKYK